MPDYAAARTGLVLVFQMEIRRTHMAIVNTIRKLVIEFVASVEAHYTLDTIAYRAQANQSDPRFGSSGALRRRY
jgi:hypothetical protein